MMHGPQNVKNRHCHLKGYLFKLGLINSPECDGCNQVSETASHVLCSCEGLARLRFRHLVWHFVKPGNFEDIPISSILHFVQGVGVLDAW